MSPLLPSGPLVGIYCSRYAESGPHKRRHELLLQFCSQTRLRMPAWRAYSSRQTARGAAADSLLVNQQLTTTVPADTSLTAAQTAQLSTAQRSTGAIPVQCPATTRAGRRASMSCMVGSILGARSRGARLKPGAAHISSTAHTAWRTQHTAVTQ